MKKCVQHSDAMGPFIFAPLSVLVWLSFVQVQTDPEQVLRLAQLFWYKTVIPSQFLVTENPSINGSFQYT